MRNEKISVAIRLIVMAVFASAALLTPYLATKGTAGWSDDWFNQKVTSGSGYFQGQKRGYYTGGSFSGRWQNTSDHLFNVQTPYIRAGCGGIDAFMGGMGFLDFEFLVEKLQRILQGAAGYAFQIGLKVLAQEAASALEFTEGVADMLNSIQLDDCKAGKALVAFAADKIPFGEKTKGAIAETVGDVSLTQGYEQHFKKIQRGWEGMANKISGTETAILNESRNNCPSGFKNAFFTEGSLLHNLGSEMGLPTSYVDLMSGVLGDVWITMNAGVPTANPITPVNGTIPIENLISGQAKGVDASGNTIDIVEPSGGLSNQVGTMMQQIANAMKNKSQLNAQQIAFIDSNPANVQLVLRTAVGTNQEVAVISSLTDVTAKAYAFRMAADLYSRINEALSKMDRIKNETAEDDKCKTQLAGIAMDDFSSLNSKLRDLIAVTQRAHANSQQEAAVLYQMAAHFEKFDKMAKQELTNRFGGAVTGRIMAGR